MTSIVSANQNLLISIVIPTFNRAATIRYCLDSILNQTYKNIEVIVVDDCSTDRTVEVVKDYDDPRIRCIVLEKNSGAQAARNTGIKEAKGDWIAFQDSDDEWWPDKLKRQVTVLSKTAFDPFTVIHSNAIRYSHESNIKSIWNVPVVEGKPEMIYPRLLAAPGPMYPSLLVSKLSLIRINYLDENVPSYQEWDTSIRLAKYCRFIHIQKPLFVYHLHHEETISKNLQKDFAGYQYVIEKHEKDIKNICGETTWNNQLSTLLQKCLEFGLREDFKNLIEKYLITDKYIERAYIKHISHCLDNEKWEEADSYFPKCSKDNRLILFLLKLCRTFYFKPSYLSKYKWLLKKVWI